MDALRSILGQRADLSPIYTVPRFTIAAVHVMKPAGSSIPTEVKQSVYVGKTDNS